MQHVHLEAILGMVFCSQSLLTAVHFFPVAQYLEMDGGLCCLSLGTCCWAVPPGWKNSSLVKWGAGTNLQIFFQHSVSNLDTSLSG